MKYLISLCLLATALFLSGCQSAQTAKKTSTPTPSPDNKPAHPDDGAPRITLADAKAAFDAGDAIFVDTRPEETYKQEHVKGAINITLMDDASKYDKIPKGKKIIVYCS